MADALAVFLSEMEPIEKENWPFRPPADNPPRDRPPKDRPPKDGPPKDGPGRDGPGRLRDIYKEIRVKGEPSPHGIGMHPTQDGPSRLTYDLGGGFDEFIANVGLNHSAPHDIKGAHFVLRGDGRLLWQSRAIRSPDDVDDCRVSVKGVRRLRLEVSAEGETRGAHGVWVEPRVTKGRP